MSIYKELQKTHPEVSGKLIITKDNLNKILVHGNIQCNNVKELKKDLSDLLFEKYKQIVPITGVNFNQGFTVLEENVITTTHNDKDSAGEVHIIYNGMLPINCIKKAEKFKLFTQANFDKIDNAIIELRFIAPIILDSNLNIIDGNLRYDLALSNNIKEVPVIIIYDNVSPFVDEIPVAQPILEPLGFFGEKLLPESYFSNTMFEYKIDVFNDQQSKYTQDTTIAEWAQYRRNEILENQQKLKAQKEKKQKAKVKKGKSLFDMFQPTETDFVETYDINEEIAKQVAENRETAEIVTENYDKERKAIIEARGGKWQNSTRQSKTKAADTRKGVLDYINSLNISEEEKEEIINNIDTFESRKELYNYVKELLNNEE